MDTMESRPQGGNREEVSCLISLQGDWHPLPPEVMRSGSLVQLVFEGQTCLGLGLGKALTWSSWQPFLQLLQAHGRPGPSCTGLGGVPGCVRSRQDRVMGLVAMPT